MIQDIYPHKLDNSYKDYQIDDNSFVFIFDDNKVYLEDGKIPAYKSIKEVDKLIDEKVTFLFKIDKTKFFLLDDVSQLHKDNLTAENFNIFREMNDECMRLAGVTALHLYRWYSSNRFCGKCGHAMKKDHIERAMVCPHCKTKVYPTIAPVIMVGIINKDKILLTKYAAGNYKKYTLVAGFVEIGETFEEAVKREVMEEVGIKVKNIKYYKSQPWGYSGAMMTGFFAELDGADTVTLQREELSEAEWFKQNDVPVMESMISISADMMTAFRKGLVSKNI